MTTLSLFSDRGRMLSNLGAGQHFRARRVTVLIVGVIVLSLADLVITLTHLRSSGMIEANPIAAWLIRYSQSPWMLSLFKLCTVGVCGTLLYRTRHHLSGELAAWAAVGILTGMSFMWFGYSEQLPSVDTVQLAASAAAGEEWLVLP